jgi:hypothetical protein
VKATKPDKKLPRETTCSPLAHPMRVRILEVVNEHPLSPVGFINAGFAPDIEDRQRALSLVSYHFRALEKAGCLKIVDTVQRRGATEHVYGGCSRVFLSDKDFDALPAERRQALSRTTWQGLVARTDGAMRKGTFDARSDRHLTWRAMELDERGWKEITDRLATCFEDCEQIRRDAQDRLAVSGDKVVPMTMAMLGFESPPRPDLA